MPLRIVHGDITRFPTDAIVNSANTSLAMGGGVCGAIFRAAGTPFLQEECGRIGGCPPGEAVITSGGDLPARHIVHTVGPVWEGGGAGEEDLLRDCYRNSLRLAWEHACESIAFPLISAGIFGYPRDQAIQVAVSAIAGFLAEHDMQVDLVIYGTGGLHPCRDTLAGIREHLETHLESRSVAPPPFLAFMQMDAYEEVDTAEGIMGSTPAPDVDSRGLGTELRAWMGATPGESFSRRLLRLIDEKGLRDTDAYKRANVDRRLFSKIRSSEDYHPSRNTAIAFAIALELDRDETVDLLESAGYTLSRSIPSDLIIEFFIEKQEYDIHKINMALFACNQALLGA